MVSAELDALLDEVDSVIDGHDLDDAISVLGMALADCAAQMSGGDPHSTEINDVLQYVFTSYKMICLPIDGATIN